MGVEDKQPKPGDMVLLVGLPPGFLDDLLWKRFHAHAGIGSWRRGDLARDQIGRGCAGPIKDGITRIVNGLEEDFLAKPQGRQEDP